MTLPPKSRWAATASSGDPSLAIDDLYATNWISEPSKPAWIAIDLGEPARLGGIEVYWGRQAASVYGFESSVDGEVWHPLCRTGFGEGGQNVFAFPATDARYVRLACEGAAGEKGFEIVEINLYHPDQAPSVREAGRVAALGHGPVTLAEGESITVDFGYVRLPLGALIKWGDRHGTDFSVYLSDDGEIFRELGRIDTGNGDYDNFYWRSTTSRYFRLTIHKASSHQGAIVNELKLRILDKDRMPIGQLERAALAGRGELYPQSLLGRQVYWTVLGEIDHGEEALFDEFGNLEARHGYGQLGALLRLDGVLHGAPGADSVKQSLAEGSLPVPSVTWSARGIELRTTALAQAGAALLEYRLTNRSGEPRKGALVLAIRPVQINPYWQHGGHAVINAIALAGRQAQVNDQTYAVFSSEPQAVAIVDFENGDVVKAIDKQPGQTPHSLRSGSGLVSGAFEFEFELPAGSSIPFFVSCPMRDGIAPNPDLPFGDIRDQVVAMWRQKLGFRRISVGDPEITETVEAQTALILVNANQFAFKPGPRHYDRTWIRDGSSQALALLWAGLFEEAKRYVIWYAERIYPNGMVPPILNPDGSINTGYGSDIEFDAQGEFVAIAADTYRITRDPDFLKEVFEAVVRATRFIEELCARTNAIHGPETRFYDLLAPSISHEGYNKPTYSYWDDFFALSAWRNCEFLASEIGDRAIADYARAKGQAFAAGLARSMRLTAEVQGKGMVPASADRDDVDPTSTSVAFEPCRVDDVLPSDLIPATYDNYASHLVAIRAPGFDGGFTPYEIRNLNAFVALGRYDDAFGLLTDALTWRRPPGWRHWAEVVWGNPRAPEYIGDMPHTWIGAEFFTAIRRMLLRENGNTLELFRAVPDSWWEGDGIALNELPSTFGTVNLRARRSPSVVTVDLALTGPAPETITLRYPGAKHAQADGKPCLISGDLVTAPPFRQLVIGT